MSTNTNLLLLVLVVWGLLLHLEDSSATELEIRLRDLHVIL
jgi:hypothetical protein